MRFFIEDQDPDKRAPGAGAAGLKALPAPNLSAEKPGSTATGCGHGGELPSLTMWLGISPTPDTRQG